MQPGEKQGQALRVSAGTPPLPLAGMVQTTGSPSALGAAHGNTDTAGHIWMMGKRHSKKHRPGSYSQCRVGVPRSGPEGVRGGGHWGLTAAAPTTLLSFSPVLAAGSWEPFPSPSISRVLFHEPCYLPKPSPSSFSAPRPISPHKYRTETRVHAFGSSAR